MAGKTIELKQLQENERSILMPLLILRPSAILIESEDMSVFYRYIFKIKIAEILLMAISLNLLLNFLMIISC